MIMKFISWQIMENIKAVFVRNRLIYLSGVKIYFLLNLKEHHTETAFYI